MLAGNLGHRPQAIVGGQDQIGLGVGEVEDQDWPISRELVGPHMAVDQDERPTLPLGFISQERIGDPDRGGHTPQRLALDGRVQAPVTAVVLELVGVNGAELEDAVTQAMRPGLFG